jgi:hypothetical protein
MTSAKTALSSVKGTLRRICFSKNVIATDEYYKFHLIDSCRELTHVDNHILEDDLLDLLKIMSFEKDWDKLADKLNGFYTSKIEGVFSAHDERKIEQIRKDHNLEVMFGEQLHSLNSVVHGIINYIVEKSNAQRVSIDETK